MTRPRSTHKIVRRSTIGHPIEAAAALTEADLDLLASGLESLAADADHDAEFGGSDEPEVSRRIAADCRGLRRKLEGLRK